MTSRSKDESDRERWDRKYAAGEGPTHFRPNSLLVQNQQLLRNGRALDVACGFGGNALLLARRGFQVEAVDISAVGLARARSEAIRRDLEIDWVQADLARWWIPPGRYDVILVFYYLNRELAPHLAGGLRPGGYLFQANRNKAFLSVRPDFDPDYLLEPGELAEMARKAGLEVVHYARTPPGESHNSQLIARKPKSPL
jgi:2-polyprenyl-3-methyl-5-hydroxy-6-metoxy-1,4-benzoquinol methylase